MVTVITAYLSFIIKAVAAERVAECGGLLQSLAKSALLEYELSYHQTVVSEAHRLDTIRPSVEVSSRIPASILADRSTHEFYHTNLNVPA